MGKTSIYKRKDGRWEARITLGKDKNGKRKTKSFYGRTWEEARSKLIAATENGDFQSLTELSVRELCEDWLHILGRRIKLSTAANYRSKLEKHIIPYFEGCLCSRVTRRQAYSFIEMMFSEGLSARYVCDILVIVKAVFRYGRKEYGISDPFEDIIMPKSGRNDVKLLSSAQINELKEYISKNNSPAAIGAAMALTLGLRLGEICALQWTDIDINKRTLTVRRTVQRVSSVTSQHLQENVKRTQLIIMPPKSESSARTIPIPDILFVLLNSLERHDGTYVFGSGGKPLEPRTMQYRFAKLLVDANLPSVTFHSLRHAFATNAIELGFDIKTLSEILGHSKVEITLNRYVHSSIDRKRSCMELIDWKA